MSQGCSPCSYKGVGNLRLSALINVPPTTANTHTHTHTHTHTSCRWLLSGPHIEEINLEGNLIGDGGAREVLEALQGRKEGT